MADDNTDTTTDNPDNAPPADAEVDAPADDATGADDKQKDQEAQLPEWVVKELSRARGEAANYRTQLREAQAALKDAKTPEEFTAAIAEFETKVQTLERSVLVSQVAREHDLPDELAEVLKGKTKEELEAHAKTLQKFTVVVDNRNPKLKGGLNPGSKSEELDPRKLAGRRR